MDKMTAEDLGLSLPRWWAVRTIERIHEQGIVKYDHFMPRIDWRLLQNEIEAAVAGALVATRN